MGGEVGAGGEEGVEEGGGFGGGEGVESVLVAEGEEGVEGGYEEGGGDVVVEVGHYGGLWGEGISGWVVFWRGERGSCVVEVAEEVDFGFQVVRSGGRCCCFEGVGGGGFGAVDVVDVAFFAGG